MTHSLLPASPTEQPEPVRIAVTIYPDEMRMIEQVARRVGTKSMAQAIRFITNWADISEYNKIPATEPQS